MWGHRFENIVNFHKPSDAYVADYDKFDNTYAVSGNFLLIQTSELEQKNTKNIFFFTFQVDTPLCSAKRLDEVVTEVNDYFESPEYVDETKLLDEKVRTFFCYLMLIV